MKLLRTAALALALSFSAVVFAEEEQFLHQESKESGYAIDLPLAWDIRANIKGYDCLAFAPPMAKDDRYLDNISVRISEGDDAADAAQTALKDLKAKHSDLVLHSEGKLKIDGCEAFRIEYSYRFDNVQLRNAELFIVKGKRLWTILLCADMKHFVARKPLFDQCEKSFKTL